MQTDEAATSLPTFQKGTRYTGCAQGARVVTSALLLLSRSGLMVQPPPPPQGHSLLSQLPVPTLTLTLTAANSTDAESSALELS